MRIRPSHWLARPGVLAAGILGMCLMAPGIVEDAGTVTGHPRPATPARSAASGPVGVSSPTAPPRAVRGHPTRTPAVALPAVGRPLAIAIPSLGVRAPVVPVAADDRVLVPPADPSTVGWWSDGARPGADHGAAVLTGHSVSTGGGVFDDLDRLRPGATVRVTTARGAVRYIVGKVVVVPKRSLPEHAARLFDQAGPARLVLVTCEDWDGEVHLSNQVVVGETTAGDAVGRG